MPEFHPGTEVEIVSGVPQSGFRCGIPNVKRYQKRNNVKLEDIGKAGHEGDLDLLEEMLATGDEINLFNGDLNRHITDITALHIAALKGNTECVELLLRAKADPHMKQQMNYGHDPEDGKTALDLAKEQGWDDVVEILEDAEKNTPYGFYIPEGKRNNEKCYNCWEWNGKPLRGWHSGRPGVAERQGFDPSRYGRTLYWDAEDDDDILADIIVPDRDVQAHLPVALLFPGQGSQYVKMMSSVKDIPAVADMLATAREILGYDLLKLCLQGPESKLEETRYCQPAMFVAGLAGIEKLRAERENSATRFRACAGLSLGEYTALCAAGVFTFEDALKLVKLRGEAMHEAAEKGNQKMLSVAGLDKAMLVKLCKDAQERAGGVCQIANELFPKGFSCAGNDAAIMSLKDEALKAGALQAKVLNTSGAFHTSLMKPAREKLGAALDEVLPRMSSPRHAVYMNVNAKPLRPGAKPEEIVSLLKDQLINPVLWESSMRAMIGDGIEEFYEVGPMKQIKAMMKRIDPKVWAATASVEV